MIVLQLKTPFDPGMYDQGNTYPHALVTTFNMATIAGIIEIRWEYGTMDEQRGWISGKAAIPQNTILQNDEFYTAIAAMPQADSKDSILMAVARECYQILASHAETAGDVVDITITPPAPAAAAQSSDSTATSTATPSASAS